MMSFRFLLFTFLALNVSAQECSADGELCDNHKDCSIWKESGECEKNPEYMKKTCPVSCLDDNDSSQSCKDYHTHCKVWADLGECTENEKDMKRYCAKSCNLCKESGNEDITHELCVDKHESCSFWSDAGECEVNPTYMNQHCAKSCGSCSTITTNNEISTNEEDSDEGKEKGYIKTKEDKKIMLTDEEKNLARLSTTFGVIQTIDGDEYKKTLDNIQKTLDYMKNEDGEILEGALKNCKNEHELCAFWSSMGECEKNEGFMIAKCAPSCKSCDLMDDR